MEIPSKEAPEITLLEDEETTVGVKSRVILFNDEWHTFEEVISQIKNLGTANVIVIISAKPSIERWHLKGKYKRLNRRFKKMCAADPLLEFADVWTPMLVGRKLREDLFIEDGLHMNDKGYLIWYDVLKKFLN